MITTFAVLHCVAILIVPPEQRRPQLLHTLKGFSYGLTFSPDGKTLAAGGLTLRGDVKSDRDIVLWDLATGRDVLRLKGQRDVRSVAYSPDGTSLATGGDDLRIWDVKTGKVVRSAKGEVGALAYSPDGKTLAIGRSTRVELTMVALWDAEKLKLDVALPFTERVNVLTFSTDGKLLACAGPGEGIVGLWDVPGKKERARIDLGTQPRRPASTSAVAFSRDGKTLAVNVWYGMPREKGPLPQWATNDVHLWNTDTGKALGEFSGHAKNVRAVAYSPDGKLFASAAEDVRIWDVASGKALATLKEVPDTLAFSPDSKLLATATTAGGDIKVWSLERGK